MIGTASNVLLGFDGDDSLYGDAGNDTLSGEFDNDFLDGGAGSDFLDGGPGDDILVFDAQDQLHGGTGTDTIRVDGSGVTVGLSGTSSNIINGIEVIDLTGSGANTLSVNDTDLTSKTDSGTLRVDGASGDAVVSSSSWTSGGTTTINSLTYNVYTSGSATLQVQDTIDVSGLSVAGAAPTFMITDDGAPESDGTVTFVVTRTGDTSAATTVDFATSDFGATAGVDYTATNGTLAFAAGESIKFITVNITADTTFERAETFAVTLSNAGNGESIPGPPATGTIRNDDATLDLGTLGSFGFTLEGQEASSRHGASVDIIGDVNGDGFADVIVGAYQYGGGNEGKAFVVFGSSAPSATVNLSTLGSGGLAVTGLDSIDQLGTSVSGAGDINGVGFADFIIGAPPGDGAANGGASAGGDIAVVFGNGSGLPTALTAESLGTDGFMIFGALAGDQAGGSVSSAGDVNGDGYDDLIIGARFGDGLADGVADGGEAYVVFGGATVGSGGAIQLSTLTAGDGSTGFVLNGITAADQWGQWVSSAGDINGDGIDDLLVSSIQVDSANFNVGQTVVVFGKTTFAANIALSDIVASVGGFDITGVLASDHSGNSTTLLSVPRALTPTPLFVPARVTSSSAAISLAASCSKALLRRRHRPAPPPRRS